MPTASVGTIETNQASCRSVLRSVCPSVCLSPFREAAGNFLTALSLQRKSRSHQLSHQVMSGNIWAALRIALSMMDQPELFQAANIGDLDLLMKAFNLDI